MAHLALSDIVPGMKTADVILAPNGQMLLPKGSILNEKVLEILKRREITHIEVAEEKPEEDFCAVYTEDMVKKAEDDATEVIKVNNPNDTYIQALKSGAVKVYLKRLASKI
jgi:hypothetical protein